MSVRMQASVGSVALEAQPDPTGDHARGIVRIDARASSPPGRFLDRSFDDAGASQTYKIYLPAGFLDASTEGMPMIVMLHGATQCPDDFAAGTRMNAFADEHGFVVLYPAQTSNASMQKCWNWFRAEDQVRGSGEPAMLAGITREVTSTYRIDERRIFVAGMSAGAAMAVILGRTYPDLYAAVGAHSGLPYGVASDMFSAFAAMQGLRGWPGAEIDAAHIPTIVFHGDSDRTVNAQNANTIIAHVTASHDPVTLQADNETGAVAGGGSYSRVTYSHVPTDAHVSNGVVAEHWTLHGAGHAWSGGSPAGTFTDVQGPDASREMIRFFLSVPRTGNA